MPSTVGTGGAKTKRSQRLLTRNPQKQTFNVMERTMGETRYNIMAANVGVHKASQSRMGCKGVPEDRTQT